MNEPKPRVVGLIGAAGAGKTTAAKYLAGHWGFRHTRFGGPLKDMLRALGLTDAQVDGDQKEEPSELLGGRTPRHAMQTLGTEWGRELIHPDLWVRAWVHSARQLPAVVVDDCRFPNEAAAIRELGGVIIRVVRPGTELAGHVSETGQVRIRPDAEAVNNGDLTLFNARLCIALSRLGVL